jgi:hypothetical protein
MSRTRVGENVRIFGIRHHGPGSARSLLAALEEWRPQRLVIEGPSEAEAIVPHLLNVGTVMPVAMLFYSVENPQWASYYPVAEFSPELQACRWALENGAPVSFMDLPASARLGLNVRRSRHSEAMDQIAEAAGFEDVEDWWDHLVEHKGNSTELFEGMAELMTALKEAGYEEVEVEEEPGEDGLRSISDSEYEEIREAHMRRVLREQASSGDRVGVVCGAWHVPALLEHPPVKQDDAALKGLPKLKVGATVVPWTYELLTYASGYGAGARSPAFYDLLWNIPASDVPSRWLMQVARLMREEDLDASPASVIEAVRLAEALASLRGRPRPGLRELGEAAGSVMIRDESIWRLISKRLIVGERMGSVPESVPLLPLQADLAAQQKSLRLKVDDTDRVLELDLRGEMDLQRSHLMHRLQILEIPWGEQELVLGKKGTFHEHWRIKWQPDLAIAIIHASLFGNTVVSAATARAVKSAGEAGALTEISFLVQQVLLADLADAVTPVVERLQSLSTTSADVAELADALPPLAAVVRYGSVRRTEIEQVLPVLDAIFTRMCIGLPAACISLDDEAASAMMKRLGEVTAVVRLFDDAEKVALWTGTLQALADLQGGHRLVSGKAERLRFDLGVVDGEYLALRLRQESSPGASALETAAFVEGLLDGAGMILLHQESLFKALDEWLVALDGGRFDESLPLVRRTFALFTKPERRQIGEMVAGGRVLRSEDAEIDEERASRVLPVIRQILGVAE